jgi:adenine phosphoribosyltransferase
MCIKKCVNVSKVKLRKESEVKKLDYKSIIRQFPFKGVAFWDIAPLLKDKAVFKEIIDKLAEHYKDKKIDVIVSNEARGFIIGAPLAYALNVGFVPIRKKGKLPGECAAITYQKEYEADTIEMQEDAIAKGENVLIIDDLLATGGTIKANIELVEKQSGNIVGLGFLIELDYCGGRNLIGNKYEIFSLVRYENTNP